jgi:hypothetical protein
MAGVMWSHTTSLLDNYTNRIEEDAHFSLFSKHWPDAHTPTPQGIDTQHWCGVVPLLQWEQVATGSAQIADLPPSRPLRFVSTLAIVLANATDGAPTHADCEWARENSSSRFRELPVVMAFNSQWKPGNPKLDAVVAALQTTDRVAVYARNFDMMRSDLFALNALIWNTRARTFFRKLPSIQ